MSLAGPVGRHGGAARARVRAVPAGRVARAVREPHAVGRAPAQPGPPFPADVPDEPGHGHRGDPLGERRVVAHVVQVRDAVVPGQKRLAGLLTSSAASASRNSSSLFSSSTVARPRPTDAKKAVELGVDGIVVSNHAGRQVDGAIASLDALEKIVDGEFCLHSFH